MAETTMQKTPAEKTKELLDLAQEIQNLTTSPLYEFRCKQGYHPVIGEGNPEAHVMFVGEAPGEQEAKSGRPFVGASGRFLSELLQTIGLRRDDVYITNVVKDRPPENRDPSPAEIRLYAPFLARQLAIIQPHIIATLGRFAMDFIFKHFDMAEQGQKISKIHGKVLSAQAPYGEIAIMPLYHPAVALYATAQKQTLLDDVQILHQLIQTSSISKAQTGES